MDLQTGRAIAIAFIAVIACGCAADRPPRPPAYAMVATGDAGSSVRLFRSANHLVYTTLDDASRMDAIVATLEAAHAVCVDLTGVRPAGDDLPQNVFVFERRAEWEAFTRSRAGDDAPTYLKLDRGGYTLGKSCVVRDQGEHETLTVLAHESMHLFIATHFKARPPPFVEEGLATLLENVRVEGGVARIDIAGNASRATRLRAIVDAHALLPLRSLLAMHAGNIIGLSGAEVDAFYAQAWAFVRFLRDGEGGRYRPMLASLLADAASGALSSDTMAENASMLERYAGESLETLDAKYRAFAERLAGDVSDH